MAATGVHVLTRTLMGVDLGAGYSWGPVYVFAPKELHTSSPGLRPHNPGCAYVCNLRPRRACHCARHAFGWKRPDPLKDGRIYWSLAGARSCAVVASGRRAAQTRLSL